MRATSIRINAQPAHLDIEKYLITILNRLDRAVFVIDSSFAIHFANDCARVLAQRADAIAIERQRLVFLVRSVHERVCEFTEQNDCSDLRCSYRCSLPRASGQRDYLLAVHRLATAQQDPRFSVEIYEPEQFVVKCEALRDLFGLTAMEANVVAGLFATRNVRELAQQLGISGNTVRTHIRAAYGKCEVHSLSQLFQLIALSPR